MGRDCLWEGFLEKMFFGLGKVYFQYFTSFLAYLLFSANYTRSLNTPLVLTFFFGRRWFECPHFFLRQLVARGGSEA